MFWQRKNPLIAKLMKRYLLTSYCAAMDNVLLKLLNLRLLIESKFPKGQGSKTLSRDFVFTFTNLKGPCRKKFHQAVSWDFPYVQIFFNLMIKPKKENEFSESFFRNMNFWNTKKYYDSNDLDKVLTFLCSILLVEDENLNFSFFIELK